MTRSNIAASINAAHAGVEAAKREGARYAVECGRLLAQAKETVPHGGWDSWLRLNTTVSPRTAQLYMRIARHVEGDPAKAQRVAGLSVREAAAEATGPKRATVVRGPLSPDGEAALTELKGCWGEARDSPHWKEGFARELYRRGDITLEQRDRIIKAAWYNPDLTDDQRRDAMRRATAMIRDRLSPEQWQAVRPVLEQYSGEDIAIALMDAVERRQAHRH